MALAFNWAFEPAGRMFFSTRLASVEIVSSANQADPAAAPATDKEELFSQDRIDELVEARDFYRLLNLSSPNAGQEEIRTQCVYIVCYPVGGSQ